MKQASFALATLAAVVLLVAGALLGVATPAVAQDTSPAAAAAEIQKFVDDLQVVDTPGWTAILVGVFGPIPHWVIVREADWRLWPSASVYYRSQEGLPGPTEFGPGALGQGTSRDGWWKTGSNIVDSSQTAGELAALDLAGNIQPGQGGQLLAYLQVECSAQKAWALSLGYVVEVPPGGNPGNEFIFIAPSIPGWTAQSAQAYAQACATSTPTPTNTPVNTSTSTPTPTDTPTPTSTSTGTPTSTSTGTPTSTSTGTPTSQGNPGIAIAKSPDLQQVVSGGTVTFTIRVTNTGDVTLNPVAVSDPQAPNCNRNLGSMAPGAVQSYTCTLANVTAGFTNVANVTGMPPSGPPVTDNDDAVVVVTSAPPACPADGCKIWFPITSQPACWDVIGGGWNAQPLPHGVWPFTIRPLQYAAEFLYQVSWNGVHKFWTLDQGGHTMINRVAWEYWDSQTGEWRGMPSTQEGVYSVTLPLGTAKLRITDLGLGQPGICGRMVLDPLE